MQHLFVYGTLAPGEENHHLMEVISGSWQPASTFGKVQAQTEGVHIGYPCFIPAESGDVVSGMVFSSEQLDDLWPSLDEFEGDAYGRHMIEVTTLDGETLNAYVYVDLKSL